MKSPEKVRIIPRKGIVLKDPETRRPIPEEGIMVHLNTFWMRRLADGDVTKAEIKKEFKNEKKGDRK